MKGPLFAKILLFGEYGITTLKGLSIPYNFYRALKLNANGAFLDFMRN